MGGGGDWGDCTDRGSEAGKRRVSSRKGRLGGAAGEWGSWGDEKDSVLKLGPEMEKWVGATC